MCLSVSLRTCVILFPNQRDLRRSTGTDDESFAKRKQHALAQEIYDLFDQRQREEKTQAFQSALMLLRRMPSLVWRLSSSTVIYRT
jgi:hypothetical protein